MENKSPNMGAMWFRGRAKRALALGVRVHAVPPLKSLGPSWQCVPQQLSSRDAQARPPTTTDHFPGGSMLAGKAGRFGDLGRAQRQYNGAEQKCALFFCSAQAMHAAANAGLSRQDTHSRTVVVRYPA